MTSPTARTHSARAITLSLTSISLVAALTLAIAPAAEAAPSGVTVSAAWVRASEYSDHVGGMTGIFAKITNHTRHTVVLIGGSTSAAAMVQTHQVVGGVMSEKKTGIAIKPGKSVILQPGGLHVMLMNLKKAILPGSKIRFTFKFRGAKALTRTLTAKVAAAGGENYTPSPAPTK